MKNNALFTLGFLSVIMQLVLGLKYPDPDIIVGVNRDFSEMPDEAYDYTNFSIVKDHFPGTLQLDPDTGEIHGSCEYTFSTRNFRIMAYNNNSVEETTISITSIYSIYLFIKKK